MFQFKQILGDYIDDMMISIENNPNVYNMIHEDTEQNSRAFSFNYGIWNESESKPFSQGDNFSIFKPIEQQNQDHNDDIDIIKLFTEDETELMQVYNQQFAQQDNQESVQQEKIDQFTYPLIFEPSVELNGNYTYQNFAQVPVNEFTVMMIKTSQDNHTQNYYDFSSTDSKNVLDKQTNPLLFEQSSESQKSEEIQQKRGKGRPKSSKTNNNSIVIKNGSVSIAKYSVDHHLLLKKKRLIVKKCREGKIDKSNGDTQCRFCPKMCKKKSIKMHEKKCRLNPDNPMVPCDKCGDSFQKNGIKNHEKTCKHIRMS